MHTHICGVTDEVEEYESGVKAEDGCGFEWQHEPPPIDCTAEENRQLHMCPNCGAGPWYVKAVNEHGERFEDRSEEEKQASAAMVEFLRAFNTRTESTA